MEKKLTHYFKPGASPASFSTPRSTPRTKSPPARRKPGRPRKRPFEEIAAEADAQGLETLQTNSEIEHSPSKYHICMLIIEFIIVIVRLFATFIIVFIVTLCTVVPEPSQDSSRSVMHRMYSVAQKKKVAEYARFHGARAAARHFGIHRRCVGRWLQEHLDSGIGSSKKRGRKNKKGQGRKLSYPEELDNKVLQWVLEKRDLQLAVTTEMLQIQARLIITPVVPTFKASDGWAQKFFRRHSLVLRAKTSLAQKLPRDLEEKITAFHAKVTELRSSTDVAYQ